MHMTDLGKQKAASGGQPWAALAGGEACMPLNYLTTPPAEKQAAISKHLASDYAKARALAISHARLAERFMSEAERLAALIRESEALT